MSVTTTIERVLASRILIPELTIVPDRGATDAEIYETIDVAIEMGGGQAGAYARFVFKAMEYFKTKHGERR